MLCPGHPLCLFVSCSAHTCSNSCFRQVDDQTPNNPPATITNTAWHALLWQIQLNFKSCYMAKKRESTGREWTCSECLPEKWTKSWRLKLNNGWTWEHSSKKTTTHLSFHFDSQTESVCMKLILSHKILLHHDDNLFKHCLISYILHSSRIRLSVLEHQIWLCSPHTQFSYKPEWQPLFITIIYTKLIP